MIIKYLPDKEITYICLRRIWPFFKKGCGSTVWSFGADIMLS